MSFPQILQDPADALFENMHHTLNFRSGCKTECGRVIEINFHGDHIAASAAQCSIRVWHKHPGRIRNEQLGAGLWGDHVQFAGHAGTAAVSLLTRPRTFLSPASRAQHLKKIPTLYVLTFGYSLQCGLEIIHVQRSICESLRYFIEIHSHLDGG